MHTDGSFEIIGTLANSDCIRQSNVELANNEKLLNCCMCRKFFEDDRKFGFYVIAVGGI